MSNKTQSPYTILQLVAINETGDSYYRMRWPAEQLIAQAPNWRLINLDARAKERFAWAEHADLLVTYQSHDLDLIPILKRRRLAGKKTLVEYNDNFYSPPPASPVASAWSSPVMAQSYERFISESDGLIVTGPGLQQLFASKVSAPIHILRNHLPRKLPTFESVWQEPEDEIRIGLAGSLGHMSDYMAIVPSLRALFEKFPQAVLHLMGNDSLPGVIGLPENRVRFTPWGSMEDYFRFLRPLHLGLAPLLDTPYNLCRSDVKALELAGSGALPILPDLLPYQDFLTETALRSYGNFSELVGFVSELLSEPGKIRGLVERCFRYVEKNRIGPEQRERLSLYESFLSPEPAKFVWPMPVGYHEIEGVADDQTRENLVLQQAQDLVKASKIAAALELVKQELTVNPYLPGLALTELKLLARSEAEPAWLKCYDAHRSLFPRDLRFLLLRLQQSASTDAAPAWQEVCSLLFEASPLYREYFEAMVVGVFSDVLKKNPGILPLGEYLVEIYPDSMQLRLALAYAHEHRGDYLKAVTHCRWLTRAKDIAVKNEKALAGYDRTFLLTWLESLEGRLRMNLNSDSDM